MASIFCLTLFYLVQSVRAQGIGILTIGECSLASVMIKEIIFSADYRLRAKK